MKPDMLPEQRTARRQSPRQRPAGVGRAVHAAIGAVPLSRRDGAGMHLKVAAVLGNMALVAGCVGGPRADVAYQGNGDAQFVSFMRGNYMSGATGLAERVERQLKAGLRPGQVIDKRYLVERGAMCDDGAPVTCNFDAVVDERFSGMPEENAAYAHRVTTLEVRVLLLDTAKVSVIKRESYPGAKPPAS